MTAGLNHHCPGASGVDEVSQPTAMRAILVPWLNPEMYSFGTHTSRIIAIVRLDVGCQNTEESLRWAGGDAWNNQL